MPETSSQCSSQPSGFLRLPPEIRKKVYCHLLVRSAILSHFLEYEVDSWTISLWEYPERQTLNHGIANVTPKSITGILSVSRQISEEALQVLYGRNIFTVQLRGGDYNTNLKFGTVNLSRIRYVELLAESSGMNYPEPIKFDSQLWIPLLADLRQLCLVAGQPPSVYISRSPEEEMREWIAWLEPVLRFLADNISGSTIVGIDDNNMLETSEVVEKYLRSGYARMQTLAGDLSFNRGRFSGESGWCACALME